MRWFEHHNALSIGEAVELLNNYAGKAKAMAGGSDLLGALKDQVLPEYPQAVINLKTIEGLDFIRHDEKGLAIGALTKLCDIVESPVVREEYNLLGEAARSVATPQIRNVATIGGNLAQDTRCWFYRYPRHIGGPMVCLRKGGKFCSAMAGDNRYHSIFGAAALPGSSSAGKVRKGCLAVNPSDIAVALVALDALIVTTKRTVAAEIFFKATAMTSTILESDELITEIQIPRLPGKTRHTYEKFILRKPVDFAVVSVASVLTMENNLCKDARIVLGAVAPDPLRARNAEDVIKGRAIDEHVAAEASEQALAGAKPLKMNNHKVEIAKVLVRRAIQR
jgi:xanthine dehydrogenase YagS FAD-binding subunit